ncbi:PREDICTED: uncharacterized protein LOC18595777 isoform X3 [Theobroma cacao]|uniref:Uncharacterized protein LOC18595777 isoform X3 n=1 Tax=Theobroma cacao TaxID=3641 RepID=A0AB32WJV5_THECC|nr:PREDICTED: uncharacterized protein LOC18595777 isoform X3 [Theobroma cacao]
MRFKKGSKVEVLTKEEVSTSAWRCAEIISGNGHTYSVKYGWFPNTGEAAAVKRVPRKAIRPCPPPVNGTNDWVSGDVVEVFDELCWKPAVIVRVFSENNFFVRILGSNSELSAHKYRLRVRQSWEDGNWFLIGKGSSNFTGPPRRKRSLPGFSNVGGQKKRITEKGGVGVQRIIIRLPSPASEKRCGGGCSVSTSVKLGTDYHSSELQAYQQALRALHASGPLTWEEEEKKSHGQCWRHPYLASKAMIGLSFVIFAVDQGAISMVFS